MISPALMDVLCCPSCRSNLRLSFGGLECTGCTTAYPIHHGIPRFADPRGTGHGFSFHRTHATFPTLRQQAEAEVTFTSKTALSRAELKGKVVLDAGCGSGRYLDIASRWGAVAIGVDLSGRIDRTATCLASRHNIALVQAHPHQLPFRDDVFDVIYSGDSTSSLDDAHRAFVRLPRYLKPGGTLAVWLGHGVDTADATWPGQLKRWTHAVTGLATRRSQPPAETLESAPESPRTRAWFEQAGLTDIELLDMNTAVRGRRAAHSAAEAA